MICLATYVSSYAATETTVYCAIPSSTLGNYTLKLNVNFQGYGGEDWHTYEMQNTGKTYFGKLIYKYEYRDSYDGVSTMQFQLYDGDTWIEEKVAYSSWIGVSNYNGKMFEYDNTWRNYNYDKTFTVHCLKKNDWTDIFVCNEFNDYDDNWSTEVTFPGSTPTQNTLNSNWYDYTVTGRPCTRVVFSNGNDGSGNRSGDITIGDASEYWLTYDGTNTTCDSDIPADFNYTRGELENGKFGTICLPYAATIEGATVFQITSMVKDGTTLLGLNLTSVDNLSAGTPYIFKASGSSFTATLSGNYTDAVPANGMVGNLSATPVDVTTGYVVYGNKLCPVGENVTVGQYRAYITLNGIGEAASRSANFLGFEDVTGIENIQAEGVKDVVYNLQGQRVTEAQKGLVIVGGKKMLRK